MKAGATSTAVKLALENCRAKAISGQVDILNGDAYRAQLTDYNFADICREVGVDEDTVITAMVDSGEWTRVPDAGFNLRKWVAK